jgi:hypothetical protein
MRPVLTAQAAVSVLHLRQVDERDNRSAYALRIGERPVYPPAGGVVFSKLSKLLNQEDALSAPCLKDFQFCSPQAPSRSAGTLRTDLIRLF